jgi:glycosyltransferase involved in cell wall biosynthesis
MKIGIDAFGTDHGKSGLGSYLKSFVNSIPDDDSLQFEIFGDDIDRYTFNKEKDVPFCGIDVNDNLKSVRRWHRFLSQGFVKKSGYDAVLYTAGGRIIPPKFSTKSVAVVNEIIGNIFRGENFLSRNAIKKGLSRADCIIVPSMFVKKNLERSGVKSRRVEIVHNGIDHSLFFPVDSIVSESGTLDIKPFAIKKPYLIYASRMQGKEKKHVELIKAFSVFKEKTGLPHRLVLAGSDGPYGGEVQKAVKASRFGCDIFITGYFPHESLPELYRNSEACIFPSVNEGVGLPVLEVMACGVPVACAKAGALPEIAGDGAVYFDADDAEGMAETIQKVATDESLRKKLSAGGIERASRFSWKKCAEETVAILKSL